MGYFNFYIFKKIIRHLFSNKKLVKILLILIFALLLLFVLKNKTFAMSAPTIEYNNQNYTFTYLRSNYNKFSDYNYYYLAIFAGYNNRTFFTLVLSNTELCYKPYNNTWYMQSANGSNITNLCLTQSGELYTNTHTLEVQSAGTTNGDNRITQQPSNSFTYPSMTDNKSPATSFYANYNFNFVNSNNEKMGSLVSIDTPPSLITSSSDIQNWSFEFLEIDAGTTSTINYDIIQLTYNGRTELFPANNYYHSNTNLFRIDVNEINSKFVIVEDADFNIGYLDVTSLSPYQSTLYDFGTYNVVISSSIVANINDNTDRDLQNNMYEAQQQTNLELSNLNNTITDDTVEVGAEDLPTTNVTNPTETGIDNIFNSIYNAFCVGEAQDIIFPIPFTNKNITLSPYYVSDMLNNNGAGWVYLLIQAFWGYLIGRYIISDISKKIDKIKSGNIENVENSNIKEEML